MPIAFGAGAHPFCCGSFGACVAAPPISAFTAAGAKFDLSRLTNALVVADIYDKTGNIAIKGNTTKVFVDAVYWSK